MRGDRIRIVITYHAHQRMERYNLGRDLVLSTVRHPESVRPARGEREVRERALNGYVLRVVVEEEEEGLWVVVTVYKARRDRYAG